MGKVSITEGAIWKQLLTYFLPILLGTLFQQLYNTADAVIAGRLLGKEALAAIGGGTGLIVSMLTGFFIGLASGSSVVIAQEYGAGDDGDVPGAVHTATALALAGGIVAIPLGIVITNPLLSMLRTPSPVVPLASRYLRVYFLGAPAVVLYNMGSSIFRAVGDSRTPFTFLVLSCMLNIALDLVFIGVLGLSLEGAAYATIISQGIAAALTFLTLMRHEGPERIIIHKLGFNLPLLSRMLTIGIPQGLQSMLYAVSNMIVQGSINSYGTDAVAAEAAFAKLDTIYWSVSNSYGIALTTFTGQNYGAGKMGRIREALKVSARLLGLTSVAFSFLYILLAPYALHIFTSDPDVLGTGSLIVRSVSPFYIIYVPVEILSASLRGSGRPLAPTIIPIIGVCLARTLWLYAVMALRPDLGLVMLCHPFSWLVTSACFLIYFRRSGAYYELFKARHIM